MAAWERLSAAARKEAAGSGARVSLISAAFTHAPPGNTDQRSYFRSQIAAYARTGTNDEKIEACAALGQAGEADVLPLLIGLLDDRDPDVRVSAANAVLRIGPR